MVSPQSRYSAEEALAHPFFQQYVVEEVRHFSPRGKFKVLKLPPTEGLGAAAAGPEVQAYKSFLSPEFPGYLPFPSHPFL